MRLEPLAFCPCETSKIVGAQSDAARDGTSLEAVALRMHRIVRCWIHGRE